MTTVAERFALEFPRDPAFMATARIFASSLARHFEIEEDTVEDLKLAISEACARALVGRNGGAPVSLTVARDDARLVFEVGQGEVDEAMRSAGADDDQLAAGLSLELISALFEDAELATDDRGGSVVRFSVS